MPSVLTTPLQASITFSLPKAEIDNPEQYTLKYDPDNQPPSSTLTVPIWDLRDELDAGMGGRDAGQQLDQTGFAAIKHESAYANIDTLSTEEGTNAYLAESCRLFESLLSASTGDKVRVIPWNSVIRAASVHEIQQTQTQQQKVEKNAPPAANTKATAGSAHVDQDEAYARTIIRRALAEEEGDPFEKYKRCQIINLWRPLQGPVTNKPLAVSDFFSMRVERDVMDMAGSFGGAYTVSYHPDQKWSYISHQLPSETLWLRCYDSNMGRNGEALYTGHVAVDVLDEADPKGLEGQPKIPRTSVEVRLVVLHE